MNQTLQACAEGRISPQVAVAHFVLAGAGTDEIRQALAAASAHPALDAIGALLDGREARIDTLAAEVVATHGAHNAAGEGGVAQIARFFDRAVTASPEASVALYSLGDPAILAAATAEIVGWLDGQGVLGGDVLDLGCGFGRVASELAPRCRSVLGLDVSPGMIAEAGRRFGGTPTLRFAVTSGIDLASVADGSFDLCLAIDSFPYIVQAGLAPRHLDEIGRVLRPSGTLVVLNLSYEGGAHDAAAAPAWAAAHRFRLTECGARPFRVWDGSAYVFRR